jgi:hypothetical protein
VLAGARVDCEASRERCTLRPSDAIDSTISVPRSCKLWQYSSNIASSVPRIAAKRRSRQKSALSAHLGRNSAKCSKVIRSMSASDIVDNSCTPIGGTPKNRCAARGSATAIVLASVRISRNTFPASLAVQHAWLPLKRTGRRSCLNTPVHQSGRAKLQSKRTMGVRAASTQACESNRFHRSRLHRKISTVVEGSLLAICASHFRHLSLRACAISKLRALAQRYACGIRA